MMGLINFIQKKPSDKTIRLGRISFGILYIVLISSSFFYSNGTIESSLFFGLINLDENIIEILKYILILPGILPIAMGSMNLCLLKKKHLKILSIIFGIYLIYISKIINLPVSNFLNQSDILGLMCIFPFFNGITGKCITTKCSKYKEKITKIRV